MAALRVLATAILLLASPAPRVTVDVYPRAILVNGTIRATCKVPRHEDNRWLDIVVPGVTSSGRQLDGDSAAITHTLLVPHMPCDVNEISCAVTTVRGDVFRSSTPLSVGGCGE